MPPLWYLPPSLGVVSSHSRAFLWKCVVVWGRMPSFTCRMSAVCMLLRQRYTHTHTHPEPDIFPSTSPANVQPVAFLSSAEPNPFFALFFSACMKPWGLSCLGFVLCLVFGDIFLSFGRGGWFLERRCGLCLVYVTCGICRSFCATFLISAE